MLIFIQYYRMSHEQLEDLRQAEQKAVKASMAKSEFLSSMSHDIRTPMNGIVGMTAIAQANINDPARVTGCLAKIALSSKHLLGLINDVLDLRMPFGVPHDLTASISKPHHPLLQWRSHAGCPPDLE